MTADKLHKQIQRLIDAEFRAMDSAAQRIYLDRRRELQREAAEFWAKIELGSARLDRQVGNIRYVSRIEATKYGRLDRFDDNVRGIIRRGATMDISNVRVHGRRIYELEHNGMAWIYNRGYGLPVTAGVRVPLMTAAITSDFYGARFDQVLRRNWAQFADDIMGAVNRNLNQGRAYTHLADDIVNLTNRSYADSLRVARTEAHRIQSMGNQDSLLLLDEVGAQYTKVWVSTADDRTRPDHVDMDGVESDSNGIFTLPDGSRGPQPGLIGDPSQDINCRCTSVVTINGVSFEDQQEVGPRRPFAEFEGT